MLSTLLNQFKLVYGPFGPSNKQPGRNQMYQNLKEGLPVLIYAVGTVLLYQYHR